MTIVDCFLKRSKWTSYFLLVKPKGTNYYEAISVNKFLKQISVQFISQSKDMCITFSLGKHKWSDQVLSCRNGRHLNPNVECFASCFDQALLWLVNPTRSVSLTWWTANLLIEQDFWAIVVMMVDFNKNSQPTANIDISVGYFETRRTSFALRFWFLI